LHKNLFFTAEAGVKIKGLFQHLLYPEIYATGHYSSSFSISFYSPNNQDDTYEKFKYFSSSGTRDLSKISYNLLLGIGLYYKLPYGDLLRFTVGLNKSFNNIIEGYYIYHLTGSIGAFSVKNDFIYTQLSYIHTLNFQKAKRYLKKNDYTFSSKKERRKKIFDLGYSVNSIQTAKE
jgi:hypothetical protein